MNLLLAFRQGARKAFSGDREYKKLIATARDAAVSDDRVLDELSAYMLNFGCNPDSREGEKLTQTICAIRPSLRRK